MVLVAEPSTRGPEHHEEDAGDRQERDATELQALLTQTAGEAQRRVRKFSDLSTGTPTMLIRPPTQHALGLAGGRSDRLVVVRNFFRELFVGHAASTAICDSTIST